MFKAYPLLKGRSFLALTTTKQTKNERKKCVKKINQFNVKKTISRWIKNVSKTAVE